MDSEAERIFGISLDSVIGKPIQNLLPNIQTETNKVKNNFYVKMHIGIFLRC